MSSHIPLPKEKHHKSKLYVTRSSLSSPKAEHIRAIETHPLNYRLSIIVPSSVKAVQQTLARYIGPYYHVSLKLSDLIDPGFIANYVRRNALIALSRNRFIDADDVFAIDGRGTLVLSVCKDTYETLGLAGSQAQFPLRRGSRFIIKIDLLAEFMDPMKKYYQRVRSRFDAVFAEPVEFLMGYYDAQSGAPITLDLPGASAVDPQLTHSLSKGVSGPSVEHLLDGQTDTWNEQAQAAFEWVGLAVSGSPVVGSSWSPSSACAYQPPVSSPPTDFSIFTVTGMLCAKAISSIVKEVLESSSNIYVCVWGFEDAPISWKLYEHNYYTSGENMYAQLYAPNKNSCLTFQACGAWDAFS
ncbi:ribonuclease P 40kDa subunit-domain-containing protein [Coemansia mojavensis]|nr:ribonuclease P 40kDa subunit-domain-containing protein [Coemansia mojavensis]